MTVCVDIKHTTKKTNINSEVKLVFGSIDHGWNWQTIVIGANFLFFLLSAKYLVSIMTSRNLMWQNGWVNG